MWLMTKIGFFSVVKHNADPGVMVVRARDKNQLLRLSRENPVNGFPVMLTERDHDYPARAFIPVETWAEIADWLTYQIDYGNFKNAVEADTRNSDSYVDFLHDTWRSGRNITPTQREPRA